MKISEANYLDTHAGYIFDNTTPEKCIKHSDELVEYAKEVLNSYTLEQIESIKNLEGLHNSTDKHDRIMKQYIKLKIATI